MNAAHRKPAVRAIRSRGFTLIELMIALTIGLILVGGLFSMFVSSSANLSELKKSAEHLENGSMATRILNLDLAHAGYYGEYYALPAPGAALPDPCALTAAALYAALAYPVQGYDAPATSPLTCLGNNDFVPGTDILVVRAAEPAVLAATDIPVANEVYLQGISTTAEVQFGAGAAPIGTTNKADGTATDLFLKDGVSAASIRKLEVHIYFIAPCSMPSDGGDSCTGAGDDGGRPIPTLKRLELTSVGGITGWRLVPLVEGIENLQVQYGVDNLPAIQDVATGQFGDGAPDTYVAAPALADWPNVVSAEMHLIARATTATAGFRDAKTYDMGIAGTVGPFNDAYKRHLFENCARLINVSGRREIPQ